MATASALGRSQKRSLFLDLLCRGERLGGHELFAISRALEKTLVQRARCGETRQNQWLWHHGPSHRCEPAPGTAATAAQPKSHRERQMPEAERRATGIAREASRTMCRQSRTWTSITPRNIPCFLSAGVRANSDVLDDFKSANWGISGSSCGGRRQTLCHQASHAGGAAVQRHAGQQASD